MPVLFICNTRPTLLKQAINLSAAHATQLKGHESFSLSRLNCLFKGTSALAISKKKDYNATKVVVNPFRL